MNQKQGFELVSDVSWSKWFLDVTSVHVIHKLGIHVKPSVRGNKVRYYNIDTREFTKNTFSLRAQPPAYVLSLAQPTQCRLYGVAWRLPMSLFARSTTLSLIHECR